MADPYQDIMGTSSSPSSIADMTHGRGQYGYNPNAIFNPGNFEDIYGPITSPQYQAQQEDIRGQVARAYNAGTAGIEGQAAARGFQPGSGAEAALLGRNAGQASSSYASALAGLRQNYINARLQQYMQKLGGAQTIALLHYKYLTEKDAQKKSFWGSLLQSALGIGGTIAGAVIGKPPVPAAANYGLPDSAY